MLAANPQNAGRCIYCAFRSRQLALQARRHRSTNSNHTTKHFRPALDGPPPKITYIRQGAKAGDRESSRGSAGKDARRGSARGSVAEGNLEQWGLGRKTKAWSMQGDREDYNDVLHKRIAVLKEELSEAPILEQLKQEKQDGGAKAEPFNKLWKSFTRKIVTDGGGPFGEAWGAKEEDTSKTARAELREAYKTRGVRALDDRIKYAFYAHVTGSRFTESDIRNQKALADLRYPTEWYPATRSIHRTIHLHVGPTNSGKTYQALQRLEAAQRGVYAGPLRLLAHEVYTRMNAKGKSCSLITGEERRGAQDKVKEPSPGAGNPDMSACTVEMMPLNKTLDVAVIDEIQMIGNAERGWAWTQALLGVKAREVHLCGEERTVPLIRELCASVGEKLEVHRYERLSPLKVAESSLGGDLRKLRKGDCIVSFSVMGIHALRRQIERQTGRKVATVYGSLPPETRAQQARLFNDPHNDYDFLVASDAVGMGLNLAIKRMIFEASSKFDGVQRRTLGIADIKQIGGRAGRYRTAEQASQEPASAQDLAAAKGDSPTEVVGSDGKVAESVGLVTTLENFDFPIVAAAMQAEPEPIRTAGLYPPASVLERFASYFPPGTPFSYILTRLHELSQMHSRFHLCGLREQLFIADLIEPIKGLTIADRNVICSAPCSKNDDMWRTLMPAFAKCIAEQSGGNILDIDSLPLEVLEAEVSASREYLRELERLHKGITTYLWLSYRFAGIFTTRALAFHVKGLVEEKIEGVLGKFSFSESERRKVVVQRQKQLLRDMLPEAEAEEEVVGEEGGKGVAVATEFKEGVADGVEVDAAATSAVNVDVEAEAGRLEQQTSLTAGGDRFGGEEDLEWEEPVIADAIEEEQPAVSSCARWREQQTQDEGSRESRNVDDDAGMGIEEAFHEGQEAAASAAEQDEIEAVSEERPSVADADMEAAAASDSAATSEALSPEQDSSVLDAPITPETELETPELPAPVETQAVPPHAEDDGNTDDAASTATSQPLNQFAGSGIPPKHLAHLDVEGEVDMAESTRDAASRP
ncbi:hypothetical protein LTR85_004588 [Meristemomyces frigidus]|nr:hypothetical protein LTR85_004588 [Meristemomyces frigidus]